MIENHVHVPLSVMQGAISFLRKNDSLPGSISNLESIVTKYTRREPGPGMTEVRAQALYEAVKGYRRTELGSVTSDAQWARVCHILTVIENGGSL